MTKRMWLITPAIAVAAVLTLAGCTAGTTPVDSSSEPQITVSPSSADLADGPTFETILPRNSTGASVALRSEGVLTPGEPVDATAAEAAEGGWIAQFACASDGAVTAEVLVNDEVVVESTTIECEVAMPESLKFSGGGTITLRITGEGEGIYVSQLTKDGAV
ncbi:hypothetical protein FVP60_09905 [Microbacterium mitrae]|uniref:Uncharacterized protein n=1 Tax=Microbacterium mitrae TaxID=664640 RepID=A0A5C8HP04_9MICO|nr:hypothetical protein [Microbacterium mitrae]TXK04073.1 hypothetical protein FVP60_09905 [Microbacterium mitrae]